MEPVPQEPLPQSSAGPAPVSEATEGRAPSRLKAAIRKARVDEAERSEVIAELRGAETARLEMLQEELQPVLADVPQDVDMFDMALMPGERPRLFIDMIGFVEMGRDRRTYRFVQDTRYGRVLIAESERLEPIVEAVTQYVARRLIEREKALAADTTLEQAARAYAESRAKPEPKGALRRKSTPPPPRAGVLGRGLIFLIEVFGSALLFALLTIGVIYAWRLLSAWLAVHH